MRSPTQRSVRAVLLAHRHRRAKSEGDIIDVTGPAGDAEVDGRPDPVAPAGRYRRRNHLRRIVVGNTVVVVVHAAGSTPRRAVLYVPGGGFIQGVTRGTWTTAALLAHRMDAEVWLVTYRLAPRQTAATTVPETTGVYRALAQEWPASQIAVIGDSAGGGLTLAMLQATATTATPMPAVAVLISPWVDLTLADDDTDGAEQRDPMLGRTRMLQCAAAYAGPLPLDDPIVSPVNGSFNGLPPAVIAAAGDDMLVYQGRRLHQAMRTAGTTVTYLEDPRMIHVHTFSDTPEGRRMLNRICEQVLDLTAGPTPAAGSTAPTPGRRSGTT